MNRPSLRHLLPLALLPVLWGCSSAVGADPAPSVRPDVNSRQSPSVGAPGVGIPEPPRVGEREPLRLAPPPAVADEYRDYCRAQGGCAGG